MVCPQSWDLKLDHATRPRVGDAVAAFKSEVRLLFLPLRRSRLVPTNCACTSVLRIPTGTADHLRRWESTEQTPDSHFLGISDTRCTAPRQARVQPCPVTTMRSTREQGQAIALRKLLVPQSSGTVVPLSLDRRARVDRRLPRELFAA